MFLLVLEFVDYLWELIGLLSDYHNKSVSIISCKTMLFCLSSDSLLTACCGSLSASLCMVSLHFSCYICSSGLSFQWECLLTGLLSNCSIALFITSWNSLMNSSLSAIQLASDKLSSSSDSSWSLLWSWGGSSAASCCCTFPVHLLDSPVTSCLSVDRHHGTCSHVLGGICSTLLSSITAPVTSLTLCMSGVSPVSFLISLHHFPIQ